MENFIKDLNKLYLYLDKQKQSDSLLYTYLENKEYNKLTIVEDFMVFLGIQDRNDEIYLALITRLISLRGDSLKQTLKKLKFNQQQIEELELKAYEFVRKYWHQKHSKTIDFINNEHLFIPFYRELFKGVHNIGIKFSDWQPIWTKTIIHQINKNLLDKFDNNEQAIHEFLISKNLLDIGHNNEIADRCYSILSEENGEFISKSYIKAFKKEVTNIVDEIEELVNKLLELEDSVYNQKWDYILYLQTLIIALSEDKVDTLVSKWAEVDRAWMKIKTPIQIGHPLEYYEDHFRKAVALEWDIRLSNPNSLKNNRAQIIKNAFCQVYNMVDIENDNIYNLTISSIDKTMLFIGRPAIFYGAQYNGMFSAQVVPNDEVVSLEFGKKIFAFSDEILQGARSKPFLKLHMEIFGQEFLKDERIILFQQPDIWHQVYDISTIGHEYGHILWCDTDSESIMNKSGHFKNIEEFKATTGGLIAFFLNKEEEPLTKYVIHDVIKRAVTLIGWQEVGEVLPYYCEGLIHLKGLFESGILLFNETSNQLTIIQNQTSFDTLQQWYLDTYIQLAKCYMKKQDAWEFLKTFVKKDKEIYLPIDPKIEAFVKYYYRRYQEIGQEIDINDKKSNYIIQ